MLPLPLPLSLSPSLPLSLSPSLPLSLFPLRLSLPLSLSLSKRARQRKFSTHLHSLSWTCDYFGQAQIHMQVDARFSLFGPPNARSIPVDRKSSVYAYNLRLFATCVNSWADLRIRLVTHRKSVRKFWFFKLGIFVFLFFCTSVF